MAARGSAKPFGLSSGLGRPTIHKEDDDMARKKKEVLKPKRFYLSFELYATPGGKPRISAGFVPSTERSLPDINTAVDDREYGIKMEAHYEAYKAVERVVREFAKILIRDGEIDTKTVSQN
jgi:hypothetical protein